MVKIKIENDKKYLIDDDKINEITKSFVEKKTGKTWYYLPENSVNRKLIDETKLIDGYELKYREPKTVSNSVNKKGFEEYFTTEELAKYNECINTAYELKQIALERKKESEKRKPLTEREKLEKRIAKMQEELAKMLEYSNEIADEDQAIESAK